MTKQGHIQIYYSARVEKLVDAFNQDIKVHYQQYQDPLKPLKVIVPNGHIQKYLNLRLTELNGISANMEFPFLETGLFEALLSLSPGNEKQHLLSIGDIELAILGFLCDQNNQDNALLSPLYNYLQSHQNTSLTAQKRWQLAQQLALLFIDYELSRPEMINAWLSGHLFFANSKNERLKQIETAQSTIYTALLKSSSDKLTLSGLLHNIDLDQPAESQPVFLFVPSRLSPLHRRIIILLARHYPVHIYHLNVCREFWQDLETDAEINWRKKIAQLNLTATDSEGRLVNSEQKVDADNLSGETFFNLQQSLDEFENPLLKAWGKPGRETLRLLSDLENDAIHAGIAYHDNLLDECLDEPIKPPQCTLRALQQGILNRIPHITSNGSHEHLSNTVLVSSAPSIEVEVSQVYNSILYELKQEPTLKLTDIVVLVTDMPTYRYIIEQVFDRLNRHVISPLRYSISDSNAGEESLYARAITQLLEIIETDFIRDEVFAFLANPCVMTAMASHQKEVEAWLQTAVDLGIFRGYQQLYDSQDEGISQLYTWRQGLQRLHRSLVQSTADKSALNSHEIGRLSVIMRQLNALKSQLKQSQTASQWQQSLQHLFDTFIAVPEDYPQEQAVVLAVTQQLQQLTDSQPQLILDYDDIKQYLLTRVADISAGRGRYLSGGIVCAALQPMRPVPFKISYILGLGESKFPGQVRHNTLDLAAYSRRIGDIDQVENNKYLFLETVMCSRDKLFLSYVGRDEQSGDKLAPSVVVNDVMDWLNQHSNNQLQALQLPLSAADNFKQQFNKDHRSMYQNHRFTDYLLYRQQTNDNQSWDETDLRLQYIGQKSELDQFNTIFNNQASTETGIRIPELEKPIHLKISDLSDYLINPTETIFAQQGGILQRIEDTELLSDEPIKINPLDKHKLFNQAIESDLKFRTGKVSSSETVGDKDLATLLDHEYNHYLQQSRVPIKLFASIEPLKEIRENEKYQSLKTQIESDQLMPWLGQLLIGQSYSQQDVCHKLAATEIISTNDRQIYLSASISHLLNNHNQQIAGQVIIRAGKHNKNKHLELMTKAFLEWCLLCLHNDLKLAEDYQVWLIFQDKVEILTLKRYLLDIKIIRDYLSRLSHDYSNQDNRYLPLSLYTDLSFKFTKKDSDAPSMAYPFKTQFYFAYQDLPPYLLDQLRQNYQQTLDQAGDVNQSFGDKKTIAYNEIKSILSYPRTNNVLSDYKDRFMLFFALLEQIDIRDLL